MAETGPASEDKVQNQSPPPAESSPVSDSVAQTNLMTLGLGPAMAMVNSYMAHSHSQSLLFANAVQQQQREALAGLSTASESAKRILSIDKDKESAV
jgi:hypothetical protein